VVALLSQGPSRVFISNQAAVERVPDNFNLPLSILFFGSILPRFCARKRRVEPPAALSGEPRDSGGPTTSPSPHIPIAYKYLESTNLSKAPRDKHTRHSPRR
jgi:hypothetical protein